jgi:hypothetical protein
MTGPGPKAVPRSQVGLVKQHEEGSRADVTGERAARPEGDEAAIPTAGQRTHGLARIRDQWGGDRAVPEITAKSRNPDEPKS